MSNTTTFQKIKNFLQKLCSFNSRKKQNLNSKKYQKKNCILISSQSLNYKNNNLTIQEQIYANRFKFHDDTYFDEENMK